MTSDADDRASSSPLDALFSLRGQVAVVTGGSGVLGSAMARGLGQAGARVAIIGRNVDRLRTAKSMLEAAGIEAMSLQADVLRREDLDRACAAVQERWGRVDILVNAAGGNIPAATTNPQRNFFDLPPEAIRQAVDLNLLGTVLPIQVFGPVMAGQQTGAIVNISSMTADRPLTQVVGYGLGKAALQNLTQWLAVDLVRRYGAGLRVNAIAPGFFLAEQNRRMLVAEDGTLSPRGQSIVDHTPAGRFGEPDELVSTLVWLCGPGASFVNGIVVPVDGGFSAFAGV